MPAIGVLTGAVVVGVGARNLGLLDDGALDAVRETSRRLLRLGVALLGLQLSLMQARALGWQQLAVVVVTVVATFTLTLWIGDRLGLGRGCALLVATGFSICGASAAAAMNAVTDSDDNDLATAVTLVTVFGTLAVVVLPAVRTPLGLDPAAYGAWVGASVQEVAQVVAASSTAGATAVAVAVVVKLTRVVLLAPLVAGASVVRRRTRPSITAAPVVPLFVVGFLVMVGVRSTAVLPALVLDGAKWVTGLLLAGALFGLGTGVHARGLARSGLRPLALGALSTMTATVVAYAGVQLVS